MKRSRPNPNRREAFSLLEVILALAILTGAIAVLGEVARLGMRNAKIAREATRAQLLCESKLAEISARIIVPDPVQDVPFETSGVEQGTVDEAAEGWLYSIDIGDVDADGLIAVCVSVTQDIPPEKRPVRFQLTRWILDPDVELAEPIDEEGNR